MTLRSSIATTSCASILLFVTGTASATIPLPDSGSCSNPGSGVCLDIGGFNTGVTFNVETTGNGAAIAGYSENDNGVRANSENYIGLSASSGAANAIVAGNNDTNRSAATISALSGSATTGLAYWGTGGIQITGTAYKPGGGSWTNPSDARIKKDIRPLRWGIEELLEIRPVTFKYNGLGGTTDDGREYVGVIAQELEKVLPTMVTSTKVKLHPTDTNELDIKAVDPSAFTFVLINAVKEQQETIDRQEHRIASLERSRTTSSSASLLGGGIGTGIALAWLPLAFIALRKRKESRVTPLT